LEAFQRHLLPGQSRDVSVVSHFRGAATDTDFAVCCKSSGATPVSSVRFSRREQQQQQRLRSMWSSIFKEL